MKKLISALIICLLLVSLVACVELNEEDGYVYYTCSK